MYDDNVFSDLHKEVYGFRPRGVIMDNWNSMAPAEKQVRWDQLCEELASNAEFDRVQELVDQIAVMDSDQLDLLAKAVAQVEQDIKAYMKLGAPNRESALRWMTQTETFHNSQCVEGWVWKQGILFTAYGKRLVTELLQIVEYN